jgi:hypothetical protein
MVGCPGQVRTHHLDLDGEQERSGSHDRYAMKHIPALYYMGADDRESCAADVLSFPAFQEALLDDDLPGLASITPDVCHDMHDCPFSIGDDWLSLVVPLITGSAADARGRPAIFVVWDESAGAGTMPLLVVAPAVRPATVVTTPLGHTSLLASTEDARGISTHLGAAATAPSLGPAFGL